MPQKDYLYGKRVVVIGFQRQGQALARWLPQVGAQVVVNDNKSADALGVDLRAYRDVEFVLGGHPDHVLDGADYVCLSGGVPLTAPLVRLASERGIPLTNDAQLFMERCPAPIIGITGSAGKTTTTTLVGQMLAKAGYPTWVGGNIGQVLLDVLPQIRPQDRVVMELSSFQLEIMSISPCVAAVLNITPNHLDRHGTMENYINAKANIIRYQRPTDVAILCKDDPGSSSLERLVAGELVWFSNGSMVPDGAFLAGDRVVLAGASSYDGAPHVLCHRDDIPLKGPHNVLNVLAAAAIVGSIGLAVDAPGIEPDIMRETITHFKPVPHRLEVVRVRRGVTYVNDSIATAPERLVAALRSYSEPLILLIGGADKDLPWQEALALALEKARYIVLFGQSGEKQVSDKVLKTLKLMGRATERIIRAITLDEAVQKAAELAQAGDVVLLSPGGTSYDAYQDFEARGEHFRQLVNNLSD